MTESRDKAIEEMPTTASFVLTVALVFWLKSEAGRRKISQSELLRSLIAEARENAKEPAAA